MLTRISQWLTPRHEARAGKTKEVYGQQRYRALLRLKHATVAILRTEFALESMDRDDQDPLDCERKRRASLSRPREQRQPLTERHACVGELCMALEECLVLGLKPRADIEQLSWWHVLYASTVIVDESTLVQSVLSAAFLSETDIGKTRCWLKIALNNHTIESSIMMIFSMACEHLIRNNYEDWSLVRCSEGLGLFLELIIALREVHFAIEVSGDPFPLLGLAEVVDSEPSNEGDIGELAFIITDNDIAAAAGVRPSRGGSLLPPLDTEPGVIENKDTENEGIQEAVTVIEGEEEEAVQFSSTLFPYRLKGVEPWQYVFGVSLASLSKNPCHSRYALIDPRLALPNIVDDCVAILRRNPDIPRLFRTTVLNIRLNQLRELVETEGSVPEDLDPQYAGALLLDFLKNLPDSLLTEDKYDAFVAAGQLRDDDASVRNITCLVNDLSVHYQVVLNRVLNLMHFLQQPDHSEKNGVDIFTASTVLAPVIAFKNDTASGLPSKCSRGRMHVQYQDLRYAAVGAQVVEQMIRHYTTIFDSVQVQVVAALEQLKAKKEALRMVSHQLKLQPLMNVSSDRQQINEISRLFREHLENRAGSLLSAFDRSTTEQATECLKTKAASDLENKCPPNTTVNLRQDSRRSTVATSSTYCSEATEHDFVNIWEQFGFNRPTVLGNFDMGGVLMLRAILYWLKNDPDALFLLKMRALPSELPSYDAGLVASSICKSLVKLLKLAFTPECPDVDIVTMSQQPFWKLFDEDMYFNKLFMLMFLVFDQLWSELDPNAASFTCVITETEGIMIELLKKAPANVNDLRAEWEATRIRRLKEADEKEKENRRELVDNEALQIAARLDSSLPSSSLRHSKKKPSFDLELDDSNSKLLDTSSILTQEHIAHIDHVLPITCQFCRWFQIYSVESNGSALETLLLLAKKQSPTLLVIKDAKGKVFGGFASDEWHHAFHYYGTGESFLFSFASSSAAGGFVKYSWSRKNNYFMLCSDESLIMGGGGNFGLFLDSDLCAGTSGACETFDSPPLTTSQQFTCVQVELWGFTTGHKPVTLEERQRKSVLDEYEDTAKPCSLWHVSNCLDK